ITLVGELKPMWLGKRTLKTFSFWVNLQIPGFMVPTDLHQIVCWRLFACLFPWRKKFPKWIMDRTNKIPGIFLNGKVTSWAKSNLKNMWEESEKLCRKI